jgi:VCBS repeat-containing protein
MQEKAHKPPTTEAPETHEPPGGMPKETPDPKAQQSAPILDMQTALLLLLLLDRLSQAEGNEHMSSPPPIEPEELVVESDPPAARENEGQDVAVPSSQLLRKHRLAVVLLALCVLVCLAVIAASLLLLVPSSATMTIIPVQQTITVSTTLSVMTSGTVKLAHHQIPGRRLSSLTLAQAETVPTTGRGFQQATQAHGRLTFYNALPQTQSIPAGTLLTSVSGIQIVTEQDAVIPAGTGAVNGQVSVSAHAIQTGPQGNIAAGTITGTCCRVYVLVTNLSAFGGGQDALPFPMVMPQDISGAATALRTSLTQSVQAALQAQVRPDETLITPVPCITRITSSHEAGGEAARVTVTMEETCTGETYATQALHAQVLRVVTQQATAQLGTGYTLTGDMQATVRQSRSSSNRQDSTLALQVSGTGTWAYRFDDAHLQHMAQLVAGKSRQQATQVLLHFPGVNQVSMTISGTDSSNLPADASRIHLLVLYRSA